MCLYRKSRRASTPSEAAVTMTLNIIAVASPLGVAVHDHLIVGR
jgi:DNA repair protein RadC